MATFLRDALAAAQAPVNISFHWDTANQLASNMESLRRARSWCSWTEDRFQPRHDFDREFTHYQSRYLLDYAPVPVCIPFCEANHPLLGGNTSGSRLCAVSSSRRSHQWQMHRIGPITSYGGEDWHSIRHSNVLDLQPILEEYGKVWITSIFVAVVDEAGDVLGNPPIHIHHSHLGKYAVPGITDFIAPLGFPHGETGCQQADGGVGCYIFRFPDGHGIELDETLLLNMLVNDVRAAGSPPMRWMVEASLEWTASSPQHNVGLWYANKAVDFHPNLPVAVLAGSQPFVTFGVPRFAESVVWGSARSTLSGRVLNLWHHVHAEGGFDEMWIVTASASQLGLERDGFELARCSEPFVPSRHGTDNEALKLRILTHMQQADLRFKCLWREPNLEYVSRVEGVEGIEARNYARQTRVQCFEGSERLTAGELMTWVVFYDTREEYLDKYDPMSSPSSARHGPSNYDPMSSPFGARLSPHRVLESAPRAAAAELVRQHIHFQSYVVWDNDASELHYWNSNQHDAYLFTTHPHHRQYEVSGPACFYATAAAGPAVCDWEVPFCHQPNYPPNLATFSGCVFYLLGAVIASTYLYPRVHAIVGTLLLVACAAACIRRRTSRPFAPTTGAATLY